MLFSGDQHIQVQQDNKGKTMIVRTWKGTVPTTKKAEYLKYIEETGLSEYRQTSGNLGVYLFLRNYDDVTEFKTMSFWDSINSIKKFAGEDYERAVYYPEDDHFLLEKSEFVEHADVIYGKSDVIDVSL